MKLTLLALLMSFAQSTWAQFQYQECTYQLLDEYNREVARNSDSNCSEAANACERERQYQVYNNLIRYGRCQKVNDYNPNPYPNPNGSCEVTLENSYGQVLRQFVSQSCSNALSNCEIERIRYETPYQTLACRIRNQDPYPYPNPNPNPYPNPAPYPGNNTCTFEVKDVRNGSIVNRFTNSSYSQQQACELSYNQCSDDARRRNQSFGGMQNYVCQKATGNGGGWGQYTSQTCNVNIISIRGQVLERTSASSSGYDANQAMNSACSQANTQCRDIIRSKSIHGPQSAYYGARCERY